MAYNWGVKKAHIRELINDIKAAARLGHPEALELALDSLRTVPQVASNDSLGEGFLAQVILPVGRLLARQPANLFRQLLADPRAALRAIGAVALAQRFFLDEGVDPGWLLTPAKDPRSEVRAALGAALKEAGEAHPQRLLHLIEEWLADPSPRARATALLTLPAPTEPYRERLVELIAPLGSDNDRDVRKALADSLRQLAGRGLAESVLGLLAVWGQEPRPNVWVIARALSGAWAAEYPGEVTAILIKIHSKTGESKALTNAQRALARHGLEIEL
jgi:hypothetical protein